jgi:Ca2+-transporting ATPase
MDDKALETLDPFPQVFARVSPEAKLRIVKALQARKNIVAFIGMETKKAKPKKKKKKKVR